MEQHLPDVDPFALLGWTFAAIATLRAALDGLERIGKVPGSLKRWTRHRAELIAEDRAREVSIRALAANASALETLAQNSAEILAAVTPNGGTSMRDSVDALVVEVREMKRQIADQLDEHNILKRAVEAHLSLHLDGPKDAA